MRLTKITALAATVTLAAAVAMASPAQATEHNGIAEAGELTLYYGQGQGYPLFDMYYSHSSLVGWTFINTGTWVNNNSASVNNRDNLYWEVWSEVNYTGYMACMWPGDKFDFVPEWRNAITSARYVTSCT